MLPLLVMSVSILLARALGVWDLLPVGSWPAATRVGLAVMLLFTASAHFTKMKADLVRMVPFCVAAARVARGRHRCAGNRRRGWAVDSIHRARGCLCSDRATDRHVTGERERRP